MYLRTTALVVAFIASAVTVLVLWPAPSSTSPDHSAFWTTSVSNGTSAVFEVEHYQSLSTMVGASDAVVLGRIVSVSEGPLGGDPGNPADSFATQDVIVEVDEVLSGSLPETDRQRVRLQSPSITVLQTERLPSSPALFFLRSRELEAERLDLPPEQAEREVGLYRIVSSQGLLADVNGKVYAAAVDRNDGLEFPLELEGLSFSTIVEQVEAAADRAP